MRVMVAIELCGLAVWSHVQTCAHAYDSCRWMTLHALARTVRRTVRSCSCCSWRSNERKPMHVSLMSRTERARCVFVGLSSVHKFQAPGRRATTFCKVAPKVCGSSVWKFLHVTLLATIILTLLRNFGKCMRCRSNCEDPRCESEGLTLTVMDAWLLSRCCCCHHHHHLNHNNHNHQVVLSYDGSIASTKLSSADSAI
jgi:hypothetical protein